MEIGPILRAMTRNKIGAILIALQIAFTMTVVVNAYFMIEERLRLMDRPSGVVEDQLFHISSRGSRPSSTARSRRKTTWSCCGRHRASSMRRLSTPYHCPAVAGP